MNLAQNGHDSGGRDSSCVKATFATNESGG